MIAYSNIKIETSVFFQMASKQQKTIFSFLKLGLSKSILKQNLLHRDILFDFDKIIDISASTYPKGSF